LGKIPVLALASASGVAAPGLWAASIARLCHLLSSGGGPGKP
jgi:hypothetical protein